MAHVLGVSVQQLVHGNAVPAKRSGPVGRLQRLFEDVSRLPRRKQDQIIQVVSALLDQHKKTG